MGFCGQVLAAEGCRGDFCETLLEASAVPSRASASQLQGGPADGQAKAQQWCYYLWDIVFKGGKKIPVWSSLFLKDFTLCKVPTLEQFMMNCSPGQGAHIDVCVGLSLWEGSDAGAGEEWEMSSP